MKSVSLIDKKVEIQESVKSPKGWNWMKLSWAWFKEGGEHEVSKIVKQRRD